MSKANPFSAYSIALLIFAVFSLILAVASNAIPNGAGPDEAHSVDTIQFYQQHKRLAYFPDDTDLVNFSSYGSTRLVRPPFSFIVAATTDALGPTPKVAYGGYRYASSLLLAATIATIFLSLYAFGQPIVIALIATITTCALPQFLFHGVYINDDSGAYLATALQFLCALMLVKNGLSRRWLLIAAAIVGFTLINKITGWIGLPALFFLFVHACYRQRRFISTLHVSTIISTLLGCFAIFIVCGGFWIALNIWHYGFDPFQIRINTQLGSEFGRIDSPNNRGYTDRFNMGYWDVITNKAFITASFKAFIGNLDLLRLPVGGTAYLWFGFILLVAVIGLISSAQTYTALCIYAVGWAFIQAAMYIHFNVTKDIQIQGKYLLPLIPLIAFFFARALLILLPDKRADRTFSLAALVITGIAVLAFVYHTRVLPFYRPVAVDFYLKNSIDLLATNNNFISEESTVRVQRNGDIALIGTHDKPRLRLNPDICDQYGQNFILQGRFDAAHDNILRVFIRQENQGSKPITARYPYPAGTNDMWWPLGSLGCRNISISPFLNSGDSLERVSLKLTPFTPRERRK